MVQVTIRKPSGEYQFVRQGKQRVVIIRSVAKIGRNDPCPCGSGQKYKKCHLLLEKEAR